jgi:hypothetical protein
MTGASVNFRRQYRALLGASLAQLAETAAKYVADKKNFKVQGVLWEEPITNFHFTASSVSLTSKTQFLQNQICAFNFFKW